MKRPVFKDMLVVVPHPDDESALCAGLILRALKKKLDVRVVFLTSGTHGRTLGLVTRRALAVARRKEAEIATLTLGVTHVNFLEYDDFDPRRQKKCSWPGVRKKLRECIGEISSQSIIVSFPPNGINGHPDHVYSAGLAHELAVETNATQLCVTTPDAKTSYPDTASYMKGQRRRKLHLPPTHRLRLTSPEGEKKLWALSHYRTQALSILDFIRRAEGNVFEENYALSCAPDRRTGKDLSDFLKIRI